MATVTRLELPGPSLRRRVQPPGGSLVLPFPVRFHETFAQEVRRNLARFASGSPNVFPLSFDVDADGSETCQLANQFVIGRDARGHLWISDWGSGFVDHGPFGSVSEICKLIASLGA